MTQLNSRLCAGEGKSKGLPCGNIGNLLAAECVARECQASFVQRPPQPQNASHQSPSVVSDVTVVFPAAFVGPPLKAVTLSGVPEALARVPLPPVSAIGK